MARRNNIAIGSITGGSILGILTWLYNPAEITEFLTDNPKLMILLVCTLVFIIVGLLTLIVGNSKKAAGSSCSKLYEEGKTWTHTVLIIDDARDVRIKIGEELQGFDVVCIGRIDDYRLASEFEIIISDIFGCSVGTTAASVLNTIKEKYPYKVVIPMSTEPAACDRLDADSEPVLKDKNYKFVSKIAHKVRDIGNDLSRANDHWTNVEKRLSSRNYASKDIERIKMNYYRFVNKQQNGL